MKQNSLSRLSPFQLISITLCCRLIINFAFTPTIVLPNVNQDAWVVEILTSVFILILYIPSLFLTSNFRNIFITDYCKVILGKWLGKILTFSIALYLLGIASIALIILLDFIECISLATTPTYLICGIILGISVFTALEGIKTIAKASEILIFYMIGTITLFTILGFNKMDFSVFFPIIKDAGFISISKSSFLYGTNRFCDGVSFLVISSYLDEKYDVNKSFLVFLVISTFFFTLMTVSVQGTMGIELPKHMNFPYYEFIRNINVYEIFQRIEFLTVPGWMIGFFLKLSTFIYESSSISKKVFNLKSEKFFIFFYSAMLYILILATDITNNAVYRNFIFNDVYYFIGFFTFIVPAFICFIYFIRKKKVDTIIREYKNQKNTT